MNPKYPVYIVSKGRADSRMTVKTLDMMKVPYFIVVEPQQRDMYAAVIDERRILTLPIGDHGKGPGLARNWCWEHSRLLGAERHWVMDDNIQGFWRFNHNRKVMVNSGSIFRAMEDFVDRYENVYIAGPQYYMFVSRKSSHVPFTTNNRIYSCLLIKNEIPYRWRGRYNEDTDLSLRVLKDGFCTVQFNAFLQWKLPTQLLSGGCTAEFYAKEGTKNKSLLLQAMHPDVARVSWKFGRWHHEVDYSQFKQRLIRKPKLNIPGEPDEYGMRLVETDIGYVTEIQRSLGAEIAEETVSLQSVNGSESETCKKETDSFQIEETASLRPPPRRLPAAPARRFVMTCPKCDGLDANCNYCRGRGTT